MRFHKGNADIIKPFALVQNDGVTPVDITGFTMKWFWLDREDVQPTGSPLTGSITDGTGGKVEFTLPVGLLAILGKYITYINGSIGAYNEDFKPINVQVVAGSP